MTEVGYETVEQELIQMGLLAEGESLYSATNLNLVHHVSAAIRAHFLFQRDVHTSFMMVKWLLSMSIRAVRCRVVVGQKVCIKLLKQKKA